MRHRKKTGKLGRPTGHRKALMASLVCGLIEEKRIKTTLAKAKAARSLAEKMVKLGRAGTLAARRRAIAVLRQEKRVATLFSDITPAMEGRPGGYTRIVKLGSRGSDGSEMALLEWVGVVIPSKKKVQQESTAAESESAS